MAHQFNIQYPVTLNSSGRLETSDNNNTSRLRLFFDFKPHQRPYASDYGSLLGIIEQERLTANPRITDVIFDLRNAIIKYFNRFLNLKGLGILQSKAEDAQDRRAEIYFQYQSKS